MIRYIRNAYRPVCSPSLPHHEDSCIIQHTDVDLGKDILSVPPPAPDNKLLLNRPWSTTQVEKAMSYIEKRYPGFTFLETTPMDFDAKDEMGVCLVSELCKLDIRDILRKYKTSFGIVFNTHPSHMPGGHWICMYCCLKSGRVCYYDSYGFLPEKEILKLMERIQEQYKEVFGKKMTMLYNDYQNQTKNVECGTFCIMFLSEMAKHGDMRKAVRYIKDDDRVRNLRTDIFTYNYRV